MANPIVCLDTHIFSFALGSSSSRNPDYTRMSKDFLRWLDDQGYSVIVPTIVVSELLAAIPNEKHHSFLSKFSSNWRIVEFDTLCAVQLAVIRHDETMKKRLKQLQENGNFGATKATLNVDAMIVATSIVHNVSTIYTYDTRMLKLAKGLISARPPDDEEFQRTLNMPED